jgi:hypothetical protein
MAGSGKRIKAAARALFAEFLVPGYPHKTRKNQECAP